MEKEIDKYIQRETNGGDKNKDRDTERRTV